MHQMDDELPNSKSVKFSSLIISNIILAIIYSLVFRYGYINFLNENFEYAGFTLINTEFDRHFLLNLFLAVMPIIFYRGLVRISSFFSIFIYLVLYIPIIFTFYLGLQRDIIQVDLINVLFSIGMIIIFQADKFYLNINFVKTNLFNPYKVIYYFTIFSSLYILFIYRNNLNFVSFEDVYIQRFSNANIGTDFFTVYILSWLSYIMAPYCLAIGLICKKWNYIFIALTACLIIYMSTAAKSVLLFPLISTSLFLLYRRGRIKKLFSFLVRSLIIILGLSLFTGNNPITSLIWFRTIGNGGFLTMHFYDFFSKFPKTYYSNIRIINLITNSYPYDSPELGLVVGSYYWTEDAGANANFWATDGIASVGLPGIILSSCFIFFVFFIINSITRKYNQLFILLCYMPFIFSVTNMSLFTSLFTGGAILMSFLLVFIPKNDDQIRKYIHN